MQRCDCFVSCCGVTSRFSFTRVLRVSYDGTLPERINQSGFSCWSHSDCWEEDGRYLFSMCVKLCHWAAITILALWSIRENTPWIPPHSEFRAELSCGKDLESDGTGHGPGNPSSKVCELGKWFSFSSINGDENTYLMGSLWGINEIHWESTHSPAPGKCSINVSCFIFGL